MKRVCDRVRGEDAEKEEKEEKKEKEEEELVEEG